MPEIRKAILPAAGLSTRFLPLTKVIPKQLLPLANYPMIRYPAKEAVESEISQLIFVLPAEQNLIFDYFKRKKRLELVLESRGQKELLESLKSFDEEFASVGLFSVIQPQPKGDSDAVWRAKKQIGKEPFAVLFTDDIFISKVPVLAQLKKIFKTSEKLVLGLKKIPPEKISLYGVAKVEKIADRLYKIKDIIEKPTLEQAPSDLAICGRYIFTPEIFNYLPKTPPNKKGEVILAETLRLMLKDGKMIYGYEVEGEWLECGKIIDWLKSNLYLCLHHPEYGPVLREWLKH